MSSDGEGEARKPAKKAKSEESCAAVGTARTTHPVEYPDSTAARARAPQQQQQQLAPEPTFEKTAVENMAELVEAKCGMMDDTLSLLERLLPELEAQVRYPDETVRSTRELLEKMPQSSETVFPVLQLLAMMAGEAEEDTPQHEAFAGYFEKLQGKARNVEGLKGRLRLLLKLDSRTDDGGLCDLVTMASPRDSPFSRDWMWSIIKARASQRPSKATYRSPRDGSSPLRIAAGQGAPLSVVRAIWEAYPAAASLPNHGGFTPLLPASTDDCTEDVFAFLLERNRAPPPEELEGAFEDAGLPSLSQPVIRECILPYLGNPLLLRSLPNCISGAPTDSTVLHHMVSYGESPLDRVRQFVRVA